ncbi:GAF domain-containing protein [Erythrobacter insulae]|uniref:GAF domain-containing protein n=1 Tax=Erythrobacter insulae TaxID=2584124 RepID=A0A547PF71_9SPHN|nr:GAF domain-containing protein [Erythrobacter insulae]TRD12786.1 GAF domain-containing protein [Erythrobacter insulae]
MQISEAGRLAALGSYHILDTPPEPELDALAQQAADIFAVPIALISLVDENRNWFKARVGLSVSEAPRPFSFCAHAIASDELLVVGNAAEDERFMRNPLVKGDPNLRFYAGAVLKNDQGHRLGTICVIDTRLRPDIVPNKFAALEALANTVMKVLDNRKLQCADAD